jgi:hypothetical protein
MATQGRLDWHASDTNQVVHRSGDGGEKTQQGVRGAILKDSSPLPADYRFGSDANEMLELRLREAQALTQAANLVRLQQPFLTPYGCGGSALEFVELSRPKERLTATRTLFVLCGYRNRSLSDSDVDRRRHGANVAAAKWARLEAH